MALPVEINPLQLKTSGAYSINKSLRFRSSASAYLNRTPASASNRTTWTWSGWVKLGQLGTNRWLFGVNAGTTDSTFTDILIASGDTLAIQGYTQNWRLTNQVFRDPSAWYHIVVAIDTTQATAANRVLLYINGQQVTSFSQNNAPTQNLNLAVNSTSSHTIGLSSGYQFDGYLAEVNFIDGQALAASSFGTYDTNGVWQPIKYSGTYGTNGFYLPFTNTASTATLGNDFSGNGNTWTVNNISLTAGSTYDSMNDSPTVSSATVANYATLNPLNKGTNQTVTNGNLTNTASGHGTVLTSIGVTTGKWYGESTLTVTGPGGIGFTSNPSAESSYTNVGGKWWCYDNTTNFIISNQTSTALYATRFAAGQVWQWAIDAVNGKVWIGVNNVWLNSTNGTTGDPVAGTNPTFTFTAGLLIWPFLENAGGPTWNVNFGQQPFSYTPPTGFNALNTYNLPTPTIANGAQYMAATTYTGTGAALTVNNGTNTTIGTTFQTDFLWLKNRSLGTGGNHVVFDVVRGGPSNELYPNLTNAETASTGALTSLNSNGFTLSNAGDLVRYNSNGNNYVAWQWKANGTGVTNTNGSITSTVSANTTAGFSVVTYTGTGANATVGHGLSVAPSMYVCKVRNGVNGWIMYHVSTGNTQFMTLNDTVAAQTAATVWNSTTPTSSVFSLGSSGGVNNSASTYVAYCWAAVPGYSAFGSYTGNGSTDGPFVYTGFRPRFVLWKSATEVSYWNILDTSRDVYNVAGNYLSPNVATAEGNSPLLDILSNGFKLRTSGAGNNASGQTYIYAAFAENPFQNSRAR